MDIRLSNESEQVVNQCIIEGLCQTPEEAVSQALNLLKHQKLIKSQSSNSSILEMAGCLTHSDVFEEDSVNFQRALRDEW